MTQYPAGSEAQFDDLVREVVEPVRRYLARRCDSTTAEDVLSETLMICWRRLLEVPTDAAVPWAIGVARLCLANAQRSQRRRQRLDTRIRTLDPPEVTTDHHSPSSQAETLVRLALSALSAKDVEILRLWAWDDLGPADIAHVLDCTVNAATVRLHRARKKLRPQLDTAAAQLGVRLERSPDMTVVKGDDEQ